MTVAIIAVVILGVSNIALIGLVSSLAKKDTVINSTTNYKVEPSFEETHITGDEDGIK